MATTYQTPGVYVEEIPTLPATIVPVATAIPAFVGRTQKAADPTGASLVKVPTRITSLNEYVALFGGPHNNVEVNVASLSLTVNTLRFRMYHALVLHFMNGGGPCYIVSTATGYTAALSTSDITNAVAELEKADEPTLIVVPESTSPTIDSQLVYETVLAHCQKMGDRFALLDVADTGDLSADATAFRDDCPASSYGAAFYPFLNVSTGYPNEAVLLTGFAGSPPPASRTLAAALFELANGDPEGIASQVMPKLEAIRALVASAALTMPPSPAVAGLYARVDRSRGVWKAPANEPLFGVSAPTLRITEDEQASLNVDATFGKSINAIRQFTGRGTLLWGSRTLLGNDAEWRYVNVRRLFLMVEESMGKALQAFVFEPNDANTWLRVKGMANNFLQGLWRQGALAGAKPDQAFFVRVGLGETMDANDILNGNLIVDIGLAATRPAEFVILRFSHKLQVS